MGALLPLLLTHPRLSAHSGPSPVGVTGQLLVQCMQGYSAPVALHSN